MVSLGGRKVTISSDANRTPGGKSGPANKDKASGQKLPNISKAKFQSSTDFYDEISSELGHSPTPWKQVRSAATPMVKGKMLCACSSRFTWSKLVEASCFG